MSDTARQIVEEAATSVRHVRVESWLDGTLLADDVPVQGAVEEQYADSPVGRLTFSVPIVDGVTSWVPIAYDDPLGAFGQRVRVSLGVAGANGQVEWINRGWFVLNAASTEGEGISVECLGLLALVDEAVLPTEYQPKAGATLASVVRALVEPGITVNDDAAPADRAVPTSITWSDNRLDALQSVLQAWPAEAVMTEDGFLAITDVPDVPDASDVVLTLTDGERGTVIEVSGKSTREGAFNAVVAKGQWPDTAGAKAGQEIVYTAYDTDSRSPYRAGGPFSPYIVPYGYASPLLTTVPQVRLAANTVLRRLRRTSSRTVTVACVPHPGVQLGDVVALTSSRLGLAAALGTVDGLVLPYHPDGGAMSLTVRLED